MKYNRYRKLEISTTPTKVKLQEPAYSQALSQENSIGGVKIKKEREADKLDI